MSDNISRELIISLLDYNSETGEFWWKERKPFLFKNDQYCKIWNRRFSGKVAGYVHSSGYVYINIEPKALLAHRLAWLIMYGDYPKTGIDHINGFRSDNRILNLREANHKQNAQNQKIKITNTSGHIGVYWSRQRSKWRSRITVNNNNIWLGDFCDIQDAAKAYIVAKEQYHIFNPILMESKEI